MKPLRSQNKNIKTKPNINNDRNIKTSPINNSTTEKVPVSVNEDTIYIYDISEVPTGTIEINESGIYNVRPYAQANVSVVSHDVYEGDYIVTPSAHHDIILETNDKVMEDDVTVLQIPYYETSNISGMTAYIADSI